MKNVINRALVAKKRNIFTLVLAIVSSVWMMSEAGERWCMPTVRSLIQTWIRTEGIFQSASTPCEEGEVCPPCLTIVLETDDKTYYLVSESKEIVDLLENVTIGTHAIIEGQPFSSKGIDYICVSNCYVITEPIGQPTGLLGSWIAINENQEINNLIVDRDCDYTPNYSGLIKSNTDDACLRKLLYNQIDNKLYISSLCGEYTSSTDSKNFTTTFSIVNDILTLDSYRYNDKTIRGLKFARNNSSSDNAEVLITGRWRVMNASDNIIYSFSTNGPFVGVGSLWMVQEDNQLKAFACYKIEPQEDGSYILAISDSWHDRNCINKYQLCKLTMDEMVWMQEENGERHYTYLKHIDADDEYEQTTDTIPLYSRDDSGSSTVDPVDPNQIYATLTGNVLTVHNNTGAQVTFTLNNTSVNNVAARARSNGQPTSFTESISVELTEDGLYEIWLTSEEWNYSVFGTVNYIRSATTITKEDPASTTKKLLRGTQILIEREGKTYMITGQEVK